ncbi:MAG TPA: response regulator [Geobacteraceae bacterium]
MDERRMLVMDDDEDVLFLVERVLSKLGYGMAAARDGGEAVRLYQEALDRGNPYAAAILDLRIPGRMGGLETSRRILELDPAAVLFVSSGDDFDPVMQDHRRYGFIGKLSKPFLYAEAAAVFKVLS